MNWTRAHKTLGVVRKGNVDVDGRVQVLDAAGCHAFDPTHHRRRRCRTLSILRRRRQTRTLCSSSFAETLRFAGYVLAPMAKS
jgi:hypothetical protein